jgi:hypothetical protein
VVTSIVVARIRLVALCGLVALAACGSATTPTPTPTTLLQARGWLCTTSTNANVIAGCARDGIVEQRSTYSAFMVGSGTVALHATYRDFDYEEYFKPTLVCSGTARTWTAGRTHGSLPPPSWFSEHLAANWPAADATFQATVRAGDVCDVSLAFDLRSPWISPYEITLTLN